MLSAIGSLVIGILIGLGVYTALKAIFKPKTNQKEDKS